MIRIICGTIDVPVGECVKLGEERIEIICAADASRLADKCDHCVLKGRSSCHFFLCSRTDRGDETDICFIEVTK